MQLRGWISMDQRALEAREATLGAEHLDTLASVNNLRSVLLRQGKYKEAEVMHQRALEAGEKVFATVFRHAHQRHQPWIGVVEPGQVQRG
jgi:Tetratricopeptide repeat